ncbi:hypothetical protein ECG_01616 [Echinococcus granulosus]|uniref:Expressed protein n=1 Tax=Echinococcus granulosus TaxID=6210 RepID=A0A068WCW2_ECHGR|nr:hypothetical protein ECG_01616 [Echinococcus granulosus]CDS15448.1 expressed protein [Echinococcus granulosus]
MKASLMRDFNCSSIGYAGGEMFNLLNNLTDHCIQILENFTDSDRLYLNDLVWRKHGYFVRRISFFLPLIRARYAFHSL